MRSAKKSHRPKRKKPNKMIHKVKKGLGAVIMSAIPGLITLAVESLNSWIKGKQNHQIDDAVAVMRRSNFEIRNELKQYKDDFLMYGKYSAESLNDVIKTVNALPQKNTRLRDLWWITNLVKFLMLWPWSITILNNNCSWNKLR